MTLDDEQERVFANEPDRNVVCSCYRSGLLVVGAFISSVCAVRTAGYCDGLKSEDELGSPRGTETEGEMV